MFTKLYFLFIQSIVIYSDNKIIPCVIGVSVALIIVKPNNKKPYNYNTLTRHNNTFEVKNINSNNTSKLPNINSNNLSKLPNINSNNLKKTIIPNFKKKTITSELCIHEIEHTNNNHENEISVIKDANQGLAILLIAEKASEKDNNNQSENNNNQSENDNDCMIETNDTSMLAISKFTDKYNDVTDDQLKKEEKKDDASTNTLIPNELNYHFTEMDNTTPTKKIIIF